MGALFAVPVLAFANSVVRYYAGEDTVPALGTEPMRPLEDDPPGTLEAEQRAAEQHAAERYAPEQHAAEQAAGDRASGPHDAEDEPDPDDPGNPVVPSDARQG